jgi:predicted enzyme related to lactoylglutathione lyase
MKSTMAVKYVHTNLVTRDWQGLAEFYINVFACKAKPPERDLKGAWVDSLTSLKNVHIRGIHLLMPGYGRSGPTLEIFQYSRRRRRTLPQTDQPGLGHIAFAVTNVTQMIKRLGKNGGRLVGKRVTTTIEGVGRVDVVYARDPEGNIIEVQKWS